MRASSRRSLAQLSGPTLLLAVVAACTSPLGLDGRHAPCPESRPVCPTTGICLLPDELSDHDLCPLGFTVRQGASLTIDVPEGAAAGVEIKGPSDLVTTPRVSGEGRTVLDVAAPHGTLFGQETMDGEERFVTIAIGTGRARSVRKVPIFVSPIAAFPSGRDDDLGTEEHPFRTFAEAAFVSRAGDTIYLRNSKDGAAEGPKTLPVVIPAGVTVHGLDGSPESGGGTTILPMRLELEGKVTLDNLRLEQRLVVRTASTRVVLHDIQAVAGVTVDAAAADTDLSISGGWTEIRSDEGNQNSLLVAADGTKVTIMSHAKVILTGDPSSAAVRIAGLSPTVTVIDSEIKCDVGTTAFRVDNDAVVDVVGTRFKGRVEIRGAGSRAGIWNSKFELAQNAGGIAFQGRELSVHNSTFLGEGIEQNALGSTVLVRDSVVQDYTRFAYRLIAGRADLGTGDEAGNNKLKPSHETWPGMVAATGLMIEAATGEGSASSSMTTYDDVKPDPCTKELRGEWPGVYRMTNDGVPITFY